MTTPPWAQEPGLFKVVCGCGSETFDFVITDFTIAVICQSCHQVNGQFDRPHDWQPFVAMGSFESNAGAWAPTGVQSVAGTPPPGPMVHTGWIDDGVAPTPEEWRVTRDTMAAAADTQTDHLAKLGPPEASPEYANAILAGGTWPGRLLALPGDVHNVGLPDGMYHREGQDDHGRWIYRLDETTLRRL